MSAQQQQGPVANHGGGVSTAPESAHGSTVLLGRNSGKLDPREHPPLPVALVGSANRSAQKRGLILGIVSGLLSGFISRRGLQLSKNASYLSGFLTGTGVAYATAAMQLEHNLSVVEGTERGLRGHIGQRGPASPGAVPGSTTDADMLKYDLQAAHTTSHEAGVGGLHAFQDRASTTRGDH